MSMRFNGLSLARNDPAILYNYFITLIWLIHSFNIKTSFVVSLQYQVKKVKYFPKGKRLIFLKLQKKT